MRKKEAWQVRAIYGLANQLGIVDGDSKDDGLHLLVYALTKKASIAALDYNAANRVYYRLKALVAENNVEAQTPNKHVQGMITPEQQKLVFRLIYRLRELDEVESTATISERACGAIRRIIGVEAQPSAMFAWISFEQGHKLIEGLKRYVRSAERRHKRNEQVHSAKTRQA